MHKVQAGHIGLETRIKSDSKIKMQQTPCCYNNQHTVVRATLTTIMSSASPVQSTVKPESVQQSTIFCPSFLSTASWPWEDGVCTPTHIERIWCGSMSVQCIKDGHVVMVSTTICLFDAFSDSLIHWLSLFHARLLF